MTDHPRPCGWLRCTYAVQGAYYLLTGLWPILHIDSFKQVTGEKTDNLPTGLDADHWLVMTVSVLVLAISLGLLSAAIRRIHHLELALIGIAAAIGLTIVDIFYVLRDVVLPVYLIDAALQIALILAWAISLSIQRTRS